MTKYIVLVLSVLGLTFMIINRFSNDKNQRRKLNFNDIMEFMVFVVLAILSARSVIADEPF